MQDPKDKPIDLPNKHLLLCCSFCHKTQKEVRHLIRAAGDSSVFICDECVDVCVLIVADGRIKDRDDKRVVWIFPTSDNPLETVRKGVSE